MLKTLKIFFIVNNVAIITFFVSCCPETKNETCALNESSASPNLGTIWMDTSIIDEEYPKIDTTTIYCGTNTDGIVAEIIEMLHYLNSGIVLPSMRLNVSPITFWIEMEKSASEKIDCFIAGVWVTDENCNDYQKASVPFYKYKETDNSYIFTTQLIENGKYVAGCPIFLVGGTNITEVRNELILLNAAESYHSVADPILEKSPYYWRPKRRINVEVNINFNSAVKDTLKTFVYIFPLDT